MMNLPYRYQPRPHRSSQIAVLWCAALLVVSLPTYAMADSTKASEYAVKAAIVFKIAKFVTWPEQAFSDHDNSLSVCVPKNDPIARAMSALRGKTIHGRVFSVKYFDENALISNACQILFLTKISGKRQRTLLNIAAKRPILTIGDNDQFLDRGGIVGLEIKQDRVHFAINVAASESSGLDISAQLLQLAKIRDKRDGS